MICFGIILHNRPAPLLITLSMAWYEDFLQVHQSNSSLSPGHTVKTVRTWSPNNVLKINIDGAFLSFLSFWGVGGVLRN